MVMAFDDDMRARLCECKGMLRVGEYTLSCCLRLATWGVGFVLSDCVYVGACVTGVCDWWCV